MPDRSSAWPGRELDGAAPPPRLLRGDAVDLERARHLTELAYGQPARPAQMALLRDLQPDGWFVMQDGEQLVAMASAISYGSFCWLGHVATHPAWRGRGLASELSRHLVGWAAERGCTTVALDASPSGRPVYERLGFQTVGDAVELAPPATGRRPGCGSAGVSALSPEGDLDELLALDRAAFGGDRSALLTALVRDPATRCLLSRDNTGLAGFLVVRPGILGPGASLRPEVAAALADTGLAEPAVDESSRLIVPTESAALGALESAGFRARRRLTHMRLGTPALPGQRHLLFAQTSYGAG